MVLWENDGHFVFYKNALSPGQHFIHHLDSWSTCLTVTNFFQYGGIIKAIKQSFGTAIMGKDGASICFLFIPFNFRLLLQDKKGSNRIYNCLTSAKKVAYKFIARWEKKLSIQLTKPKWMVRYNIPFCATRHQTTVVSIQISSQNTWSQLILSQNR